MATITELEEYFTKKGFLYTLENKSEKALMYRKLGTGCKTPYFEVFERKLTNIFIDFETKEMSIDMKVRFPSDNDFGVWAWCIRDEQRAIQKFNELSLKEK